MDILETLRNKVAAARQQGADLPREVSGPMLDRIGSRVAGGAAAAQAPTHTAPEAQVVVWCRASWGSGCDHVNVA